MKKIPTLFTRKFENHKIVDIIDEFTSPECEKAFLEGRATVKFDGSCCAIFNGVLYKRYDAKKGKTPPEGAIPCCEPDPITGHHPHWVRVDFNDPSDKWFIEAFRTTEERLHVSLQPDATYEAVGLHFNGNPYGSNYDMLIPHGELEVDVNRTFEDVKEYLNKNAMEGLVFWLDGEPICKIKRTDFGLPWPVRKE